MDHQNTPSILIAQASPSQDSLDFRLHSTYLELFTPTSLQAQEAGFDLTIVPNPGAKSEIRLRLHRDSEVQFQIFDLQGRMLQSSGRLQLAKGVHRWENFGDNMPPGTYFLHLQAGDHREVIRWLVLE